MKEIYRNFLRPLLDFTLALVTFVILMPIMVVITISLFLSNHGNPFFFQERLGINGDIFTIIKFKTMNDKKDNEGNLLSDAERLTSIGKFIRKTSLDELPQLINVLKGEMSLIGPRPLLPFYWDLYNDFQKRRNEIKPGITGWAQVNGRNSIPWEEKFRLDVWYVDNISLILDFKILIMTIFKVLKSEGINEEGHATSEEFKGNF